MYVVELQFECFDNTTIDAVERSINGLLDALRYNGQVLGREFPIIIGDGEFRARLICPEADSLHPDYHSDYVKVCLQRLTDAKVLAPKVKVLGQDLNSEQTVSYEEAGQSSWQILYTTFIHSCSPLRCGDTFRPIPLYHNPPTLNGDHKAIIKWQTEWQACDEIQMAGATQAKHSTLSEISEVSSDLFRRGWDLRGRLEYLTNIPTYYYLYRIGGESVEAEKQRLCPRCGGDWNVAQQPLHDIFHFKCDECRLVSNVSWDQLK
ncbi:MULTISPECIES: Zn-ribbon-containing protein [Vibrio]|uniref:Zn-ribbon-containing protein n=1 Tax=Vibrio casei TaxID=673372 RepID=A0A368LLI5_9VIBR|nr:MULTISPECIES: Zn-ribbon-containing protein [Vibrio]RCS72770.1 hypothetical protein CIK83_03640 [Vibrio casei]SJN39296.1 Zn-ribbon-containing, possibly nucleic-acid-binding protein [Vibrio casei]HBV74932.1 hypothetical protein [Vibrio sp.]